MQEELKGIESFLCFRLFR